MNCTRPVVLLENKYATNPLQCFFTVTNTPRVFLREIENFNNNSMNFQLKFSVSLCITTAFDM